MVGSGKNTAWAVYGFIAVFGFRSAALKYDMWMTCLYTSEVYALTGLPAFFLTFTGNKKDKLHRKIAIGLAIPRIALFWLALMLSELHGAVRTVLAVTAAGIYTVEFIFTAIRHAKAPPASITRDQVALYYGAHVSVINFALDMCANGIKKMRIQHIFLIASNAASVIILYIGLQYVDPYERAWGCYPPHERGVRHYYRGMCPQWEDYYNIPSHSDSNREQNLVCRDFGKRSRACTTGDVEVTLPIFYHIVSLMITISFSLSISLVRFKLREIGYAELMAAKKN